MNNQIAVQSGLASGTPLSDAVHAKFEQATGASEQQQAAEAMLEAQRDRFFVLRELLPKCKRVLFAPGGKFDAVPLSDELTAEFEWKYKKLQKWMIEYECFVDLLAPKSPSIRALTQCSCGGRVKVAWESRCAGCLAYDAKKAEDAYKDLEKELSEKINIVVKMDY